MLTQSMPAVIDALRSVLSPGELQNLTQALGNCQQPLSHRGSTNFAAGGPPQKGGVYTHSPWDPQQTSLPSSDSYGNVDIPGMQANWNSGNRYDSQFFFPTDQYFAQNQFFGGPQHYVQNHAHIEYLTNNTFRGGDGGFRNITINETINGEPIAGIPGPAGGAGRDGRDGAPGFNGFPGRDGALPRGQFRDLRYLRGIAPRIKFQPVAARLFTVVTAATFNAETCAVDVETTKLFAFAAPLEVCTDPVLKGVIPSIARVFQE